MLVLRFLFTCRSIFALYEAKAKFTKYPFFFVCGIVKTLLSVTRSRIDLLRRNIDGLQS